MKKFLTFLCTMLLVVTICFSASACSMFVEKNGDRNNLPDAQVAGLGVNVGTLYSTVQDSSRKKLEMEDAVAKVERSAVSIRLTGSSASGVLVDFSTENKPQNIIYIITCFHVIEDKGIINVCIPDNNFSYTNEDYIYGGVIGNVNANPYYIDGETKASVDNAVTLVGGDKVSDIAVLQLDVSKKAVSGNKKSVSDFVTAKMPPQDYSVRRGESVFAIGNPTGNLPGSVCSGIVSYLEREVYLDDIGNMMLMQIDATTNPGNSGGGLYNLYGELVGITNSGNTSYEAINFAIPISVKVGNFDNGFVPVARQLIGSYQVDDEGNFVNYGYVQNRKELIGFTVSYKQDGNAEHVYIVEVTSGTQAEAKGLKANDGVVGIKVNGAQKRFTNYKEFVAIMNSLQMGDVYSLTVSRVSYWSSQEKEIGPFEIRQFIFCDTGRYVN